ncbi:RNA polymerase sigma-70 factor [uncultured Cyclobacterium sp.]|uniref:RNA polymerase sigma-70 factor n=1 Tax=uncultured Cyclobacterium sp. TaxID=453820 RepID=UPI0030EC3315
MSEEELSRQLYLGREEAFNAIYEKYWKRLYSYAFKIFEDQIVCEDMVQEVFVRLWERAQLNQIEKLENYLFKAIKFQALNAVRNLKQTTDFEELFNHLPDNLGVDLLLEEKEMALKLEMIVKTLPIKCREVFILSRQEQLSNKEIAVKLGISKRTVEAHLNKALKIIKNNIGEIFICFYLFLNQILIINF